MAAEAGRWRMRSGRTPRFSSRGARAVAERPLVRIREWVAGSAFPWPPPGSLADGDVLVACFCVLDVRRDVTKGGKPYLRLRLMDRHGALEARVWEEADRVGAFAEAGAVLGVRGRMETFNDQRQLNVEAAAPIAVGAAELDLFLPRSRRDPDEMARELETWIGSVEDEPLRRLVEILLDPRSDTGDRFRQAPAAKRNHHAYLGGLLEHTLSLVTACDALARHYGAAVDRDLLITGALLHDVGKTREIGLELGFPYTDEGKLLGHIVLGIGMVERAAEVVPELSPERLTLLLHLIASHQGRYEWQSPREPQTLEALILHYADDLDAKIAPAMARLGALEGEGWTGYDRSLGRDLLRHPGTGAVGEPEVGYGEEDYGREPEPEPPPRETPPRSPRNGGSPPDTPTYSPETLDLFKG